MHHRTALLRMLASSVAMAALVASAPASARDRGADGSFSERASSHFQLLQDVDIDRYHGSDGAREFEKQVLEVLEDAHRRVGELLGIRPRQRVLVVIYDPGVFDAAFASRFGFRAAGFYDGSIHVRGAVRTDARLVRTLHHEYTHAAIASEAGLGLFPAWLNEGLAEYFEALSAGRRHMTPGQHRALAQAVSTGAWIPLAGLGGVSFSHLESAAASLAYLESYAVVEHLVRRDGRDEMQRLCEELIRVRNLARALDRVYGRALDEIEADLVGELRR